QTGNGQRDRKQPTHVAKVRIGQGKRAQYERIGVAWAKEDGSIFVRPYGKQIIDDGFALYPIEERDQQR
ncbi:MAG: hypothetical protein AAFR49_10890, partial [Pseudomonadota bacterium]